MSLKGHIKAVQNKMPVSVMHEQWMTANPNPVYSEEARAFAALQLAGITGSARLRKRMFRASSAKTCHRRQVLAFVGFPKQPEVLTSAQGNIFATGNFLHLKWQMLGLTAGWLKEAEVPMDREDLNAGGTADGILYDGSGFELKSINDRGYGRVMSFGPLDTHLEQTDNYMFLGDLEKYSIVYENKNNGEWREFVHHRDDKRMTEVQERFETLNGYVDDRKLPPILPDCQDMSGTQYRQCPFRDACLKMKLWPKGYPE